MEPGEQIGQGEEAADASDAQKALSPKEQIVLRALLEGKSHEEAGALVGRSRRSIQTWVQRPTFRTAMREGQDALFKETSALLHFNASWAVQQLRELVKDPKSGAYARAWAARAIVDMAVRTAVPEEQAEQLAEIREELASIRKAAAGEGEGCGCRGGPELQIAN